MIFQQFGNISMVRLLSLVAIGGVAAQQQDCVDSWCPVTKKVVELPSTFDKVSFSDCIQLCLMRDASDCEGVTFGSADASKRGVCTHYKFDESGSVQTVFAYFPTADLATVLPESIYMYKQWSGPTTVSGIGQCRKKLIDASNNANFATYANQACGTTPTHTDIIIDGQQVATKETVRFKYTPIPKGLGGEIHGGYLTLNPYGLVLSEKANPYYLSSEWDMSYGGVISEAAASTCLSAIGGYLKPIPIDASKYSPCAFDMKSANLNGSGWLLANHSGSPYYCMGDVTKVGDDWFIAIEDNIDGICNSQWQIQGHRVFNPPSLHSRQCDAGAFDGVWVDGQPYSPGDFSWFDQMTMTSGDNQLLAHTKQGDANVLFPISIDGCSITVFLQEGCDLCKATGTLSAGGETINWDTGFNDGDFWIRKNHGCCTVFDATLRGPSSLAPAPLESKSSRKDAACTEQFSGKWVDLSKGDFNHSWLPHLELLAGRPEDEVEDDTNGRMISGSLVLPVKFYEQGGKCKIKLCTAMQCPDQAYAIGTLEADEILWNVRLNYGMWDRETPSLDFCNQALAKYSCCNAGKIGCTFSPDRAVCTSHGGQFCCDPLNASNVQCGFEATTTTTTPTLV